MIAEFPHAYVKYLQSSTSEGTGFDDDAFMTMTEYGPFNFENYSEVEQFAKFLIAFCLKAKDRANDESREDNDESQGNSDESQEDNDESQEDDDESQEDRVSNLTVEFEQQSISHGTSLAREGSSNSMLVRNSPSERHAKRKEKRKVQKRGGAE